MVRNGLRIRTELTLPSAATGISRFVTVRLVDERGRVVVRTAGEAIEGGLSMRDVANPNALALESRVD